MQSDNKIIAKNTLFLYFRMMFTMIVTLFTSRIILEKLGVDDYGIYQAVGGIVGFLSFINGALATGSSRFLTYALGEENFDKLKSTFSTTLNIHILIALFVVIVAETVGLWFLYNNMMIPSERIEAAVYTYHLSILTAVFTLTQVPYNAIIIAHERMSIYAYMSVIEVSFKLGICFLLFIGGYDKLKLYATKYYYPRLKWEESNFQIPFCKDSDDENSEPEKITEQKSECNTEQKNQEILIQKLSDKITTIQQELYDVQNLLAILKGNN